MSWLEEDFMMVDLSAEPTQPFLATSVAGYKFDDVVFNGDCLI